MEEPNPRPEPLQLFLFNLPSSIATRSAPRIILRPGGIKRRNQRSFAPDAFAMPPVCANNAARGDPTFAAVFG
jgi:hypothetical protein